MNIEIIDVGDRIVGRVKSLDVIVATYEHEVWSVGMSAALPTDWYTASKVIECFELVRQRIRDKQTETALRWIEQHEDYEREQSEYR